MIISVMKRSYCATCFFIFSFSILSASSLTIYNENFALVRDEFSIDLQKVDSEQQISFSGVTAKLEPESVILSVGAEEGFFQVLEQNYRNDPVSEGLLLEHFTGSEIEFVKTHANGTQDIVLGKIIRSGYPQGNPLIEVENKLVFSLPGQPRFPALSKDAILEPTLEWTVRSDIGKTVPATISYLTRGFSWNADYNFSIDQSGEMGTLVGWVTIQNNSGTLFSDTDVKLIAGDVKKVASNQPVLSASYDSFAIRQGRAEQQVTQKSFDSFHIYNIGRRLNLRDKETKQVEFLSAKKVAVQKQYVFETSNRRIYGFTKPQTNIQFGVSGTHKVNIYHRFENKESNYLGIPLPKGVIRFYRQDTDLFEFIGESQIDHTPKNEEIVVLTGQAFDLLGERKRTDFNYIQNRKTITESFEITLSNRSENEQTIVVRELLQRWSGWTISESNFEYDKVGSNEIECEVALSPNSEKKLNYTVVYQW